MTRRVIQFSTGNVGPPRPAHASSSGPTSNSSACTPRRDKVGRDAAELCGLTDADRRDRHRRHRRAGRAAAPTASSTRHRPRPGPPTPSTRSSRFLRAGTNVVGTSLVWLVAPEQADDWLREPLQQACRAGDTTLYINGIDPGFSGDTLVYAALSLSARATAITVQEIFDYGSYDDAEFTGVSFGFGTTPDHTPIMFSARRADVDVGRAGTQPRRRPRHRTRRRPRTPREPG